MNEYPTPSRRTRRRRLRCMLSRMILAVGALALCALTMPGCNTVGGFGEDMSSFGDGWADLFAKHPE